MLVVGVAAIAHLAVGTTFHQMPTTSLGLVEYRSLHSPTVSSLATYGIRFNESRIYN
jgi:hypothetical protein